MSNQKQFQPQDSYEFGVLSQKDLAGSGDRTTARYQRGRDYEARCYSGAVFISKGCRTVQEFLERNPFNLPVNKIYTVFRKKADGTKELFGEGNFNPSLVQMPAYPQQNQVQQASPGSVIIPTPASSYGQSNYQNGYGYSGGMSDNLSAPQQQSYPQQGSYPVTPPAVYPTLRKTVDDQDVRITRMRAEIAEKDETIRSLRSQLAERERQYLHIQAQLEAQKEIATLKLNQAKSEHRREIEDMQRQHEGEINLIEERALTTARTGLSDRLDAIEKSNPLNDVLASAVPALLPLALDGIAHVFEDWMNKRYPNMRHPAPAPQGQPQSAVPQQAQQQSGQFVPSAHHYANTAPTPNYGGYATQQQQPAQAEPGLVYHDY